MDPTDFAAALTGQYALEEEIGRGGMGIVYRARDLKLDRLVAIKTLPPHLAGDAAVRNRFLREARTAGALSHPGIVPIHRADELQGQVFFVMGFVDGESMAARLRGQTRLDPLEVVRVLRDVAAALAYAHAHGVVHRDIKTENILIERGTGRALVTDFGIARLAEAGPLTATGQILGTVYYLSPEQVGGEAIDGRSDIYALGVVGYVALSGRFPFDAELASAVLVAHVTKPVPSLATLIPGLPAELVGIVEWCLAKDPAARFQSCEKLVEALDAVRPEIERHAVSRSPAPPPDPAAESGRSPLVSETEAHAVWRRAAELQALTGVHARPAPIPAERDAARDLARTSGYHLGTIREAAVEAGIASQYVDHALVERGLGDTPRPPATAPIIVRDRASPETPWFRGAPSEIDFEVVLDGEMPERDFDLLIDAIRRGTGEVGTLATVGRSLNWHCQSNRGRVIQVSVFPRGGRTTIRVSENLRRVAGGIFVGIMGAGGSWLSVMAIAAVTLSLRIPLRSHHGGLHILAGAAAAVLAVQASTYGIARTIFTSLAGRRRRAARAMIEEIAIRARESIDAATPTPLSR